MIGRLVHPLWRRLPVGLRRAAYRRVSGWLAPSIDRPEPVGGTPVVVAGLFRSPSGLGQTARLAHRALQEAGVPAHAVDVGAALMQPATLPAVDPGPVPDGPGTVLLYVNPPNVPRALGAIGRRALRGKRVVGVWVWELDVLPESWIDQSRFLHAVAAPNRFCAEVFSAGLGRSVPILPYPVTVERFPEVPPRGDRPFTVGFAFDLGSTEARKNPWAAIAAFEAAFPHEDDVKLSVKVRDPAYDPDGFARLAARMAALGAKGELLVGDWPRERTLAWMAGLDLYLSLHRSEGFGLTLAEAMCLGVPCVATDWSATAEFVTPETGYPVPATLIPAEDRDARYGLPGARWADANVAAAAEALREARADPEKRLNKGKAGRDLLNRCYNGHSFLEGMGAKPRLRPNDGEFATGFGG